MNGIVIDANLGIAVVIPLAYTEIAASKIQSWIDEETPLIVPELWGYEVTSALRKAISIELISSEEAYSALNELWALGIEQVPSTPGLHRSSLDWANRIGQRVAYNSAYLALAHELELAFWTTDRTLVKSAKAAGAEWVHYLEDE